jgi:general secretion pathway protein D
VKGTLTVLRPRLTALATAVLLAACASQQLHKEGMDQLAQGHTQDGLNSLRRASEAEPSNAQYRVDYLKQRTAMAQAAVAAGDDALSRGKPDDARERYREVLTFEPTNERAVRGLVQIEERKRAEAQFAQAERLFKGGQNEAAQEILARMAREQTMAAQARALLKEVEEKIEAARLAREEQLNANNAFRKPVTLQFRDATIKLVFEAISRATNVNIIMDRDVRPDLRTTIFVKDASVEDTINLILLQSQLEKRVLNSNTLLIYPSTPAKQREYFELKVRSFQLSNVEAAYMANVIKTMLKTRDIVTDARTNTLVMRDTPEAIAVAEQLVAANDQPDAEVMLEVEVLEVSKTRLQDLGLSWPTGFGVTIPGSAPTIDTLRALRSGDLLVPSGLSLGAQFKLTDSDANVLASPRIRTRNKEKARILVGDKVPTFSNLITPSQSGSSGGNSVITGSIQYLDVGIKLEVEPQVYADGDVGLKLNLEVSSVTNTIKSDSGLAYQIGTRSTQTALRLKDGETQILGGLIQDAERNSGARIPGLGELPILSRLFGADHSDRQKTELVVSITPHIIRQVAYSDPSLNSIWSGSEAAVRSKPIRVEPIGMVKFNDGRAPGVAAQPSSPQLAAPAAPPSPAQRGGVSVPPTAPPAFVPVPTPMSAAPAAVVPGGEAPASVGGSAVRPRPMLRPGGPTGANVIPRTRGPAPATAPEPAPEPVPAPTEPEAPSGEPAVPGTPAVGN